MLNAVWLYLPSVISSTHTQLLVKKSFPTVSKTFIQNASHDDLIQNTSHDLTQNTSHDLTQNTSHDLAQNISHDDLIQNTSHDLTQNTSHDLTQNNQMLSAL